MKPAIALAALLGAALSEEKAMTIFNFDADLPGQPPKGCELALTGKGNPGKWVALAQVDGDTTDYRSPSHLRARRSWTCVSR